MRKRTGRPRGASSQATRARILGAARTCFGRSGYAATTNKQIADEAGVTAAAIYLYFESKTALYVAAVNDAYTELVRRYRAALDRAGGDAAAGGQGRGGCSMREGLRAMLAESAKVHEADPSLAAFFSGLPLEMRRYEELAQPVAEGGAGVVALFREVVEWGVRGREITAAQAPPVLALFVACVMGFSHFAATIDATGLGGILDAFGALIDGTLFRAPPARSPRRGSRAARRRP